MKSSKNSGPIITVGVLVALTLLLAYPITYIVGPGLLKGSYQTIYVPGIPLPAGRHMKTWGLAAQPIMVNFGPGGKASPRHLLGRALWVGPFLVFHEASGRR